MKDDISIDPGDIEDFVKRFFLDNRMPEPTRKNPEMIPDYRDATLSSLALYLTQRRDELLNREVLPA